MSAYYYYGPDEQVTGPVELETLAGLLLQRRIDEQTPLWSEERDWCALGLALPQFSPPAAAAPPAPGALPPPLPPPLLPVALPRPARLAETASERGWHLEPPHPWRRWLARLIDHYSLGLLGYVTLAVSVYSMSEDVAAAEKLLSNNLVAGLVVALLSVPLCALCIGLSGTSPGKWCTGVRVTLRDGSPLGLKLALRRELRVWATGLGLGIPLVSLICMAIAYSELERERRMAWDEELGAVVQYRDTTLWSTLRMVIAALLLVLLGATLVGFTSTHTAGTP